jgi:3'-phosphoadenosine 5'-phosphosulfate sulfotransferase (PAPS reductase)/FAD synthetase
LEENDVAVLFVGARSRGDLHHPRSCGVSIGKVSSVLLRLAQKAFYPAKIPFPVLHIDTTWKFRDMITFRDVTAAKLGLDLIVHTNTKALHAGIQAWRRHIAPRFHPFHQGGEEIVDLPIEAARKCPL